MCEKHPRPYGLRGTTSERQNLPKASGDSGLEELCPDPDRTWADDHHEQGLYHYGVPNSIGTASLDDWASWDLAVNPRGRDREIHDRIFSLRPGNFGGTVSWLADTSDDREHTDGIGAAEAVKLLERLARASQPFFLGVGFYRPHTPYVAPWRYFDMYPRDRIVLPALTQADRDRVPAAAYRSALKEEDAMTDDQRREGIQGYLASVSFMDAQVGIVLDALERLKLADRTVVVFTSDQDPGA